jgi:hypothetical protein
VTKIIRLQGAGAGVTTITAGGASGTYLIEYNPTDATADYLFEITGFTFTLPGQRHGIYIDQTHSTTAELKKTRIHHNTFNQDTFRYVPISATANFASAVVDNNIFNGHQGFQLIGTDKNAWENLIATHGSGAGLYFEDNYYNMTVANAINDGARGSRWVVRYNTIAINQNTDSVFTFDMHGNQAGGGGLSGSMSGEIYGNSIIDTYARVSLLFDQRGGKALVFNNYDSVNRGDYFGPRVRNEYGEDTFPVVNPAGQPQYVSDTYIWSNYNAATLLPVDFEDATGTATGGGANYLDDTSKDIKTAAYTCGGLSTPTIFSCGLYITGGTGAGQYGLISGVTTNRVTITTNWATQPTSGSTYRIIFDGYNEVDENKTFWMMRKTGTFNGDGSASHGGGVGCGTLASRPTTCTTGVGYWATNQSCSSPLTGMVGINPTTPISGTLYKCTAPNTWTAYYTPYTYPHPLRTDCTYYPELCNSSTKTINAASCSQEDVQAAIDSAQDGNTVIVPAGNCTWTTPHCYGSSNYCAAIQIVKKSVFLQGAGVDKTIIVNRVPYTWNNLAIYVQSQAGKPVRITGFTFTDEGYTYSTAIGIDGSSKNSRIDHCKFSKGLNRVAFNGGTEGIIDHCEFINPDVGVRINGDSNAAWSRPIIPGTNNAVFVEDNNFTLNSDFGSHQSDEMIYPQDGARPVVRYNTYNATTYTRDDTPPLCSSHGNWGGVAPYYQDYRGQPIYEIYENKVFLNRSYNPMFGGAWRGGSVIIHNNNVTKLRPNSVEPITGFTEEEGWTIGGLWCYPYWTPNTNYALGDKRQSVPYNGYYYQVTTDNGASGSTEPNWPTVVNAVVNDGGLTWTNMGAAPCPIKITWPANDQVMNSFVWNNYFNGMPNDNTYLHQTTVNGYGYDDVFIQQNRDYFLHAPEPSGGRESYVMNSECTASGTPAPCCDGNGLGHCSAGHYDALIFIPSGPNAYYPYTPYIYPHPLTVAPFGTDICGEGAIASSCWCQGMKSTGYCCNGYYQTTDCGGVVQPVPGDINGDRSVDINDLVLMALHFGQKNSHPLWNATADVVANNEIDIFDVVFVASRFT